MKKIISILLILTILVGCQTTNTANLDRYSDTDLTAGFDTFVTLTTYEENEASFNEKMDTTVQLFKQYNDYFDIYNEYEGINNIKTINDNAGIAPVVVDDEILELLLNAQTMYELTNGKFDITIGSVLKVWHEYRDEGILLNMSGTLAPIPSNEELEEAKACSGWQYIEINEEEKTVYINNPCVSLDVGGNAKGYSAEKIVEALQEDTYAGFINAGGNTRIINTKPDDSDWVLGIEHPETGNSVITLNVTGSISLVTSGDYRRFFYGEDQKIYHHIIDPDTLMPANYYRSVSILTLNSGDADVLSTSLFSLSIEEGKKVLEAYNELYPETPAEAIWIMENNENKQEDENGFYADDFYITSTDGIKDKITIVE